MAGVIRPGDKVVIVKQHDLREDLGVVFNVLLVVFAGTGLSIMMSDHQPNAVLTGSGIENFKYFTVLSNVLCACVAAIRIIFYVFDKKFPAALKLISASAVVLTLIIIAFFLAPLYPDLNLYEGGNLYFHRIVPLLALADFILLKTKTGIPFRYTLIAAFLSFLYGMVYLANILVNGIGQWPDTNDWYGFLNWGYPVGIVIFAGVVMMHWFIAILLRFLNQTAEKVFGIFANEPPFTPCGRELLPDAVLILETERLVLREMTMDDYDALYAVLADPDIMQYYTVTFDESRVRDFIRRNTDRYRENGFGLWAVCLKENARMIGDCGLTLQNIDGEMLPEIGYHIRADQQRKGYAKEAAAAVLDWTFRYTEYPAVYSYCKHDNIASYKTAEAIGMHFDKEFLDEANLAVHVSSLSREEWVGRNTGIR